MAIQVKRNAAGNCIQFLGSTNPVYWNSCLSAEVDSEDPTRINVKNDIRSATIPGDYYEFFKIPFTDFLDGDGNAFANATDAAAYITSQGNVIEAQGTSYYGLWDADANTPDISAVSHVAGDFYYVGVAGSTDVDGETTWELHDSVVYNGTAWERVRNTNVPVAALESSTFQVYDVYVKATASGTMTGSALYPYNDLDVAIAAASDGATILVDGDFAISSEVVLPADKSLHFVGTDSSCVGYSVYNSGNGNCFYQSSASCTKDYSFKNLIIKNAGAYGVRLKSGNSCDIEECTFNNNGWSGAGLSTILAEAGSSLGYDSTQADLQAFWAGSETSDGGAMRIEAVTRVNVIANAVSQNLRGIRIQDCGVNGYGFITRNVASQNIESGIYIAAGSVYGGCQNVVVSMNSSAYNANNGLLVIGGINNKFSQNEVNGNWNAGFCAWGASNSTLRDSGLYDNNRCEFNGIGNTGDAKASIQINEAYNLLGTSITLNPAFRFIAEILDTQVHYTGLGSNTEKIGFLITSGVGALADNPKNIIKVDDVGFIGQDYAIDLSEVDITNLRLSLGDNSYQSVSIAAVKPPLVGNYSELPFSNHVMSIPSVNIEVDVLKQMISLREYVSGNVINTYKANELQGVEYASHIDIIQRNSDKIQLRGLTLGNVYVNGVAAGNTLNSMNNTVNAAFQMDLTEYKDFLVSEVGVNAGETLPAQADNWYIAYGSRSLEQVVTAGIVADLEDQQPFYNGDALDKGHEFTWTHDNNGGYMLGVWSGASSPVGDTDVLNSVNWSTAFAFDSANSIVSHVDSVGVDIASRYSTGYAVSNNTVLALRYGNDNYLYLIDITGGDDITIARSNTTLIGDSVTVFFGGGNQPDAKFPVMQERTDRWDIVHDFDNSENGEWADGIEDGTILRSRMTFVPGQKIAINLNHFGRGEHIGFGYLGASSAVANAENQIDDHFFYNQSEVLKGDSNNGGSWTFNTGGSGYYDPVGDGSNVGYWNGNGVNLGSISVKYTDSNVIELFHETNNELIATLNSPKDGSPLNIYFGAAENNHPANRIPELIKFDMDAADSGGNASVWYYIESPDGTYLYPLFDSAASANTIDTVEGGSGTSQGYSFPDDPTGTTWYGPDTSFVNNGTLAPSHGVYGNSTNVLWNEIATNADSTAAPTPFTDAQISVNELAALNFQIHPVDATFTTTIQSPPSWVSQATDNANITGTAPVISGDSTNYPSVDHTVTVVRTNAYGSSTGTLTITVNNLTALVSLPGTLHTGSVVASSGANQAGSVYTGPDSGSGHLVYDIATLEDGDQIEWYHQEQFLGFGIVSSGVDKTTNILDKDSSPGSRWDLLAPFTGVPSNTLGQNFGNVYGYVGLVPVGWDNNTNPQAIPTRPVYASSDVWKLYNNAGTIELSLNGVLFRSSSSTHTDPVITFATPQWLTATLLPFPTFTHTANAATAPTGFVLDHGTMDTTTLLNGDSVALMSNLSLSPGQRFIAPKSWVDTYVLPFIDGGSGEDNKVFIGVPKPGADWASVDLADFYSTLRVENQTSSLTKYSKWHAGPTPVTTNLNRLSDTDSNLHFGIEFTREGDLVTIWSPDSNPSLTTEPITGTIGHVQTWTGAYTTTGSSPLGLVVGTNGSETRVSLSETGLSVITAPSKAYEFDVTEDSSSLPLFNGLPAGDITLAAGTTYKFWLHSDSIESTDSLGICLISDNSDYTTGVTVVGTPGSFGAYLEFAIPADVPPVKFKWTSGGVAYYATLAISGSTYTAGVTGITLEGPSANQTGTNVMDSGDHGWISLDEQLSAGERLVLDNAFFTDFFGEVQGGTTIFAIGLKGSNWTNTKVINGNGAAASGLTFAGNTYIVGAFSSGSGSSVTIWPVANGVVGSYMLLNSTALMNAACAFLEIASSQDNIKIGFGSNGYYGVNAGDESTVTYDNWNAYKGESGTGYGSGHNNLDVVMSFWTFSGGAIDGDEIDWTGISEINIPTPPATNSTSWTKAVDFSGSNEHLKQVSSDVNYNPLRMNNLSVQVPTNADSSKTTNSTSARPWATAIVFKADRHSSQQHIWNSGEGAATGNDNIYLRLASNGYLYFGWGREGSGYNECLVTVVSSSNWYGVYIASKGYRASAADATSSNLALGFDIRLMYSGDSFASVSSNLSTSSNWTSTGARMDRGVSGDFTIGGRGSNRNFHGKVASMVITNLRVGQPIPTDAEIKLMITDPKKWEDDYRDGQLVRQYNSTNESTYAPLDWQYGYTSNYIWLFGDGEGDYYHQGVRNQVRWPDQNVGKLQYNSMQSNDIENVTISGLS